MAQLQDHLDELAETNYEGDTNKAFRHAAFWITTDFALSDSQVNELTAFDGPNDLEVDGAYVDDERQTIVLFQSKGGGKAVDEAAVSKFWLCPENLLSKPRVEATKRQSIVELSETLNEKLQEQYSLELVLAAQKGFTAGANKFASSKQGNGRTLVLFDGTPINLPCELKLLTQRDLEERWEYFHTPDTDGPIVVDLRARREWIYEIADPSPRSVHLTLPASEIVRVFRQKGVKYRLFQSNPRGPLANAKPNKKIEETVRDEELRRDFHLLNNGLCATCDSYEVMDDGLVHIDNLQIVNGCQTTVTLDKFTDDSILQDTLINMKLAVADSSLAERIAVASNSQTALKAKDYISFETQQETLQKGFEALPQPWYYELKQGYWRFVLNDQEKAKFKTGKRKRHIQVQPLAQASLAFGGDPATALDRVRYVFEEIRSQQEKDIYDIAFPKTVRASQLLLPWRILEYVQKQEGRVPYGTFHILWLISVVLRRKYGRESGALLSVESSWELANSIDNWFLDVYRVVNQATRAAVRSALLKPEQGVGNREYFREHKDFKPKEELIERLDNELDMARENGQDPLAKLP